MDVLARTNGRKALLNEARTDLFLFAGATARDLLLLYGYGIQTGRKTRDVDLALVVRDWNEFSTIRARLLDTGLFTGKGRTPHKLVFQEQLQISTPWRNPQLRAENLGDEARAAARELVDPLLRFGPAAERFGQGQLA